MTVSVIIPIRTGDSYPFTLVGAGEVLPISIGTRSEARNIGAQWAIFDELLFLDADMDISNINLADLNGYHFDVATAYFVTTDWADLHITTAQNWQAAVGSPTAFYGGFMYVRKAAFERIGPFQDRFMEDIEFATRAITKGYHINVFPYQVTHTRRFSGPSLSQFVRPENAGWGMNEVIVV